MPAELLWSMLACVMMVVLTVLVHYEGLRLITDLLVPRLHIPPRQEMVFVIFGVFLAHTLEVWLFALCYVLLVKTGVGHFAGIMDGSIIDYMYFSAVSYTSLGIGDVYPMGGLRLLTGVEALCGLLMIGWSASYTYLCMERLWKLHPPRQR
jgi:hypothetical protein